ncbi:hypothetical protein Q8A73_011205 [Channa argus]|nr:hypothetical protein Q8A73_011205 [Channa argus]
MELSKSLSHHREMDFIPRPCGCGRKQGCIHMSTSAAATEPDCSSSIMEEGKQPRPFSICANVREKDRFLGINSSRETPSGTSVVSGASNQTANEEEEEKDEEHRGRREASVKVLGFDSSVLLPCLCAPFTLPSPSYSSPSTRYLSVAEAAECSMVAEEDGQATC